MADDDFDVDRLAAYLHLSTAQVMRMADRGQIPGRRVAGNWRFSPGEIHHWLEARIGALDEEELVRLEDRLQPASTADELAFSLAHALPIEAVEVPLAAKTRSSVIRSMVDVGARTGWLWDVDKMADAVRQREGMHSTALDTGVALLHPRRPMPTILAEPFLAFGRTDRAIPFSGNRGVLTDCFFLILSVDDTGHLRTLARLSRLLNQAGFLDRLRQAETARDTLEVIGDAEKHLTS